MTHKMKLQKDPFERIKNGSKTIEFRLNDEKRKQIKIGDEIEFSKLPELEEKLTVKVLDLYKENTFKELFEKVLKEDDIDEKVKGMRRYYSEEEENKYGVLGIKIELI